MITSSPGSPIGSRCESLRIDDLEQEMILPAVQAVLPRVAFTGDARPENLREAVNVDRLDAEARLEVVAHGFAPGLGPEGAATDRQLAHVDAHRFGDLGDVQRIGRRRA